MSEARFDKIASRLGTRPPAVEKADFIKGWVNFTSIPATPTVRNSLNVSSLTDNGPGNIYVNFINAYVSAAYLQLVVANAGETYTGVGAKLATRGPVGVGNSAGTNVDADEINYASTGTLA